MDDGDGPRYLWIEEVDEKLNIDSNTFNAIYDLGTHITEYLFGDTMDVSCSYDRFRVQLCMEMDTDNDDDSFKLDHVYSDMVWVDTWITQVV